MRNYRKALMNLGWIAPLVFWSTTAICSLMLDDYNHLSDMVSELGALGTPTQAYFTTGLLVCAALNLIWVVNSVLVARDHDVSVWPLIFLVFFSFIAGPALYPMPLPEHSRSGLLFMLILFSAPSALLFWHSGRKRLKLHIPAIVSSLIMFAGFLVFFPEILTDYHGLKQRFLYAGWTIWCVSISLRFRKLDQIFTAELSDEKKGYC